MGHPKIRRNSQRSFGEVDVAREASLERHRAADYGDRSFGQLENCSRSGVNRSASRWTIGIGFAAIKAGMPLILFAAKGNEVYRAGKRTIAIRIRIVKNDVNFVRIFLVLVYDQQRPAAIGTQCGIRCHELMIGIVVNVARRREEAMLSSCGLNPLKVDQLACEVLREWLLDFQICVRRKKSKRPKRVVAATVNSERNVMEKINGIAAGTQE